MSGRTELGSAEATSDRDPTDPEERFRRSEAKATTAVVDVTSAREAEDRSWIARRIIWIFTAVIGVVLSLYFIAGFQTGEWSNAAGQAADLIKSVMLPVVTLVLGFYFGSRSGKG